MSYLDYMKTDVSRTDIFQESPLYELFCFNKIDDGTISEYNQNRINKFTEQVNKMLTVVISDMGYNMRNDNAVVSYINQAIFKPKMYRVVDKHRYRFDSVVDYIKQLYFYDGFNIVKRLPEDHGVKFVKDDAIVEEVSKEVVDAKYQMNFTYTEEIVSFKASPKHEEISLYLYDHRMQNYFYCNDHVVIGNKIINQRIYAIQNFNKFCCIEPVKFYYLNMKQLGLFTLEHMLKMRLVSKAFYNLFLTDVVDKTYGREAYDIFFLWVRRRISDLEDINSDVMHTDEYRQWKGLVKMDYNVLRVSTKYARFKSPFSIEYSTLGVKTPELEKKGSMFCVRHHNFRICRLCDTTLQSSYLYRLFAGYHFTQRSELVNFLERFCNRKRLTRRRMRSFFSEYTCMIPEELVVYYFYLWLRKNKIQMTVFEKDAFMKFSKGCYYANEAYKSFIGIARHVEYPNWFEMIDRDKQAIFVRQPMFKYDHKILAGYSRYDKMYQFNMKTKKMEEIASKAVGSAPTFTEIENDIIVGDFFQDVIMLRQDREHFDTQIRLTQEVKDSLNKMGFMNLDDD